MYGAMIKENERRRELIEGNYSILPHVQQIEDVRPIKFSDS